MNPLSRASEPGNPSRAFSQPRQIRARQTRALFKSRQAYQASPPATISLSVNLTRQSGLNARARTEDDSPRFEQAFPAQQVVLSLPSQAVCKGSSSKFHLTPQSRQRIHYPIAHLINAMLDHESAKISQACRLFREGQLVQQPLVPKSEGVFLDPYFI